MIDESMRPEPDDRKATKISNALIRLLGMVFLVISAMAYFGAFAFLAVLGICLFIEGCVNQ